MYIRSHFTHEDDVMVDFVNSLPRHTYFLECDGSVYEELETIQRGKLIQLHFRICGGKGGFGSLLRSFRIHKSNNQLMCRNLAGRRLADVREERLKKYVEKKEQRERESDAIRSSVIDIDLGTTSSCVAIIEEKQVIKNAKGSLTIPSIAAFKKDNERLLFGTPIRRQAVTNSHNILYAEILLVGGMARMPNVFTRRLFTLSTNYSSSKLDTTIKQIIRQLNSLIVLSIIILGIVLTFYCASIVWLYKCYQKNRMEKTSKEKSSSEKIVVINFSVSKEQIEDIIRDVVTDSAIPEKLPKHFVPPSKLDNNEMTASTPNDK